jgi:hypothetical protein
VFGAEVTSPGTTVRGEILETTFADVLCGVAPDQADPILKG